MKKLAALAAVGGVAALAILAAIMFAQALFTMPDRSRPLRRPAEVARGQVGVLDMLRFHKFTAGQFWRDEYGSADDPEEFKNLFAYSPYHNIEEGVQYPATLIMTADTDDRVVPMHSFKFGAAFDEYCRRAPRWWPRLAGLRETFAATRFNWTRVLIKEYSAPLGWTLPIVLIALWNIHRTTGLAARPVAVAVLWILLATAALLWLTLGTLKKTRVLWLAER